MSVPTYDQFVEPILRFLAMHPGGAMARDAHEAAAIALRLDDEQHQELISSGQAVYKNRAGWAHDRLKRAGLSSSPKRGFWQLTNAGLDYVRQHSTPLPSRSGALGPELYRREITWLGEPCRVGERDGSRPGLDYRQPR